MSTRPQGPRSVAPTRATAALVLAVVRLLTGCTDSDPEPDLSQSGTSAGTDEATPQGPTPRELSQQVLLAGDSQDGVSALASVTGTLVGGERLIVEVPAVQRLDDATLVRMRLSGPFGPGFADFYDRRHDDSALNLSHTLFIEDPTASGLRYLPLRSQDYRDACTCLYSPSMSGCSPGRHRRLPRPARGDRDRDPSAERHRSRPRRTARS